MRNNYHHLEPGTLGATRRTLISRLRNWEDRESWQEFFDRYWRLIYSVAIKAGLTPTEADEVVQRTIITVAKKMDGFVYDPQVCSFKGWLMHVTRLRIVDEYQKRNQRMQPLRRDDNSSRTATVERIPDPKGVELETIWDDEWEQNLITTTLERVKKRIKPEHFQIFYMSAVQGHPPREVAKMLGTNIAQVYLIRHRVVKLITREREALEAERKAWESENSSPKLNSDASSGAR